MRRRLGPRVCPLRAKDCPTGEKGRARPVDAVISMDLSAVKTAPKLARGLAGVHAVKRIAAFVDGIVSRPRREGIAENYQLEDASDLRLAPDISRQWSRTLI